MLAEQQNKMLITFNGEPRYGARKGYDIPFLRTRYIKNNMVTEYPLKGMLHVDVSEMATRLLITAMNLIPGPSDLSADQVVQLMHQLNLTPTKTKSSNILTLNKIDNQENIYTINNFLHNHVKPKTIDHNNLDSICKNVFDNWNEKLDDDITGKNIPQIWNIYKKNQNTACLEIILKHNMLDVRKTYLLFRSLEQLTTSLPIKIL